jgi:hypothetical protein
VCGQFGTDDKAFEAKIGFIPQLTKTDDEPTSFTLVGNEANRERVPSSTSASPQARALAPAALRDGAPRASCHVFRWRLFGPLGHGISRGCETFCHTPFLMSRSRTCSAPMGMPRDTYARV